MAPTPGPSVSRLTRRGAPALGLAGLVLMVVGTFLPWVQSGRARHNSYRTDGALQRLLHLGGAARVALDWWPFVGLACGAVAALFALGLVRVAAVAGLVVGALVAGVAAGALVVTGSMLVAPVRLGPIVTLAGAAAVIVAATLTLGGSRQVGPRGRDRT